MKTVKLTIIISTIVTFAVSMIYAVKALMYEIDAYDFEVFYKYFSVFFILLTTTIVLLTLFVFVLKRENKDLKIEKILVLVFLIFLLGFVLSYISMNYGNKAYFSKAFSTETQDINEDFAYNLHKKYLPFHNKYSDTDEKGAYEIYKNDLKNTTMVCVDSNIINSKGNMYYDLEFINTRNTVLHKKFELQKRVELQTDYSIEDAIIYSIDGYNLNIYENGYSYAADIRSDNEYMYITLFHADVISIEEFADACIEQYRLMKDTVEADALLVRPGSQSGDGTMIDEPKD